ncbi:HAAS signaling domain-containing protein [Niallia taxi]|uniref:DUF1700 domain-containing protein n=1 Tax=Niallia taxi TaxID=2499688 RepID=A0A437K340_9BACI|nr:DUF1700 domain-containing protein [Niallia taxi]RVT56533.1 DUF1700 domain-containing protein [Niallia taxi]
MISLNKNEFLKLLKNSLKFMSEQEKVDIVSEYNMHFEEGRLEEKSDKEIAEELGQPEEIAKELNAVYAVNRVEENRSIKSLFTAMLSIMGLSIMNFVFIIVGFFVMLILLPFFLAYIIGVPVMILSPIILVIMGFINGFSTIGVGEIIESLKGLIFGAILAFAGYLLGELLLKILIKYLRWNMSIAREKKL